MYSILLALHNITRWAILLLGVWAVGRALHGFFSAREWTATDRKSGSLYTISLDLQLLLGLLLYFVFSPITRAALSDFSGSMAASGTRFFVLEHPFMMLLALVLAHVGNVLARRAADDRSRFRRAALILGLSLLLILSGIPWERALFPGLG